MVVLTGFWEGQYKYPVGWQAAVSFDADMAETNGRLSGIISEPNTFDSEAGPLLTSVIAGTVIDGHVTFTKTYVGEGHAQHSLIYSGQLSEKRDRITGQWVTAEGGFKGPFEMTRLSTRVEETAKSINQKANI